MVFRDLKVSKAFEDQQDQVVDFEVKPADADRPPPPIVILVAVSRADRPRPIIPPNLCANADQQGTLSSGYS